MRSLSVRSTRPNCFMKVSCFCRDRLFVSPSAGILPVGTHLIASRPSWVSCLTHIWCMSTCLSFVCSLADSLVAICTVWRLSHQIVGFISGSKSRFLKNLTHHSISEPAVDRASNSACVVDFVTVRWTVDFQSIGKPKSLKMNPCELLRVSDWSANAASVAPKKIGSPGSSGTE